MFRYNAKGVSMDGGLVAPEGNYWLNIIEASDEKDGMPRVTKNGDPMVNVRCEIDEGEYLGTTVYHNVSFLPANRKGAGMAVHFLKTIGEDHQEEFEVEPENWIGRRFRAHLRVEKDLKGRPRNQIAYLIDEEKPPEQAKPKAEVDDDIPF